MRVLVLDNYDSFTWNLVQPLAAAGAECTVVRNDAVDVAGVRELAPERIVVSPGPFGPDQAGVCGEVVESFAGAVPILGVCLGMQVIAEVAGARVVESGTPVHGKQREVHHQGAGVLAGLPSPLTVGLYHSLVVQPDSLPDSLEVTAKTDAGAIMGCRLGDTLAQGLMFHPESFLTEHGTAILLNFLEADRVEP